jgi:hypothetical protein
MPLFTKPSGAARTAITYITVGALIDVWTVIYWIYLSRHPEGHADAAYYWVYGFFFSGVVLLVIGLALGRIGKAARHADTLPEGSVDAAAAPANVAAPVAPAVNPAAANQNARYYTMPAATIVPTQQGTVPVANTVPAVPPVAARQV